MKVSLFSNTIDARDGYGNITYELTRHLHQRGVGIDLLLPASQQRIVDGLALPFTPRCVLPEYVYRIYQRKGPGYVRSFDVSGADVVHDLFSFPYCLPAALSARRHAKPFLMGAQGTHGVRPLTFFPEKHILKWCYRRAKKIIVPSAFTREKILAYAGERYPIDIIHNGVNYARFAAPADPESVRARYPGKKLLLTVGGLWGRKGHDLALRALPQILARHDVAYVIVGDGNKRAELEELARSLGIRHAVDFAGRRAGAELVSHFQACDIYVHTPKVTGLKFEGFGIVYLEAGACGKPVVATDAGGIRDAVLDGETGLIAPDGDSDAIARHVITLLDDPFRARTMGEAGRDYAQKHDWNRIAEQFEIVYRGLCA